ncbi:hypothetical protein, partial [Alistipes sp.]|uniref:hypothetical protein n=1 Tax=Alistipes sp. TaxID=1872444 RepID=UPI003AB0E1B6
IGQDGKKAPNTANPTCRKSGPEGQEAPTRLQTHPGGKPNQPEARKPATRHRHKKTARRSGRFG